MRMKRMFRAAVLATVAIAAVGLSQAQGSGGQKSVSAALNVQVFPNAGQSASQQSQDEGACFDWAVQNTGTDPFELKKQSKEAKQQAKAAGDAAQDTRAGSGARGAVKGAAGGALVGAIAGDTGKGAAIGAGVGVVAGRSRQRGKENQAEANANAQVAQIDQDTKSRMQDWKNAFSVCLEAKKYMVKF